MKSGEVGQFSKVGKCTSKYDKVRNCIGDEEPLSRGEQRALMFFPKRHNSTEVHTRPGEVRPIPGRKCR